MAETRDRVHAPLGIKWSDTCLIYSSHILLLYPKNPRIKMTSMFGIKINIPLFPVFVILLSGADTITLI